jgi:hypothetical protein
MQVDVDGRGRRTSAMKSWARRSNCRYWRVPKKSSHGIYEHCEQSVIAWRASSTYSPTSDKLPKRDLADDRVSTLIDPGKPRSAQLSDLCVGGR